MVAIVASSPLPPLDHGSLSNYGETPAVDAAAAAGKKDAKKGGAGPGLTIGQFTFEPATGRIEPGARTVGCPIGRSGRY